MLCTNVCVCVCTCTVCILSFKWVRKHAGMHMCMHVWPYLCLCIWGLCVFLQEAEMGVGLNKAAVRPTCACVCVCTCKCVCVHLCACLCSPACAGS